MKRKIIYLLVVSLCMQLTFAASKEVNDALKQITQRCEKDFSAKWGEKQKGIISQVATGVGLSSYGGWGERNAAISLAVQKAPDEFKREFSKAYDKYDAGLPAYPNVSCPPPNPVSDFEYKFTDDYRHVIITGIKNTAVKSVSFPTFIEDTPVIAVTLEKAKGKPREFGEVEFYVPDGIVCFGTEYNSIKIKKIILKRIPKVFINNRIPFTQCSVDRFGYGFYGSKPEEDIKESDKYFRYNYEIDKIYHEYLLSRGIDIFDTDVSFEKLTIKKDWYRFRTSDRSIGFVNNLEFEDGCNYLEFRVACNKIKLPKTKGLVINDLVCAGRLPTQKQVIDFNGNELVEYSNLCLFYPRDYYEKQTMIKILDYNMNNKKNNSILSIKTIVKLSVESDECFETKENFDKRIKEAKEDWQKRLVK